MQNTLIVIAYDTVQTLTCYQDRKASDCVEKENGLVRSEKGKGVKKRWILKSIHQESYTICILWIVQSPSVQNFEFMCVVVSTIFGDCRLITPPQPSSCA
ncbi:unnamed protein product [Hymenolepis diminuta]|uniref:Uncharacterized protein n=1 Tax=Hymenolepis diminuta TaxID=6216 RepID=A0A564YEN2_HYMDI|nr:unnamed protein product [Hymenolepis diminuta]